MKNFVISALCASALMGTSPLVSAAQASEMTPRKCDRPIASGPSLFVWDADNLALTKSRVSSGDTSVKPAMKLLLETANKALTQGPYTVTAKTKTPPSGSKNDYYSIGPYWWPNPKTENGLPYIRKDGKTNPERTVLCGLWTQLDYSLIANI